MGANGSRFGFRRPGGARAGYVLAIIMLIFLLSAVFFPLLTHLLTSESRASVRYIGGEKAFSLAEFGLGRVESLLKESDSFWTQALSTEPVAGYADDVEYAEDTIGSYKIRLSTGPADGQVRVTVKGRDKNTGEIRSLQSVYKKSEASPRNIALAGLTPNVALGGSVHWGSIVSHGSVNFEDLSANFFPRAYAAGIVNRVPSNPFTNEIDAFGYRNDLGPIPVLDSEYYKAKAQATWLPTTTLNQLGNPAGLLCNPFCYVQPSTTTVLPGYAMRAYTFKRHTLSTNSSDIYTFRSSTSVMFLVENAYFYNTFIELEAMVVEELLISTGNPGNPDIMQVPIPENADLEYPSTAARAYWDANFNSAYNQPNHCCYPLAHVAYRGLVVIQPDLTPQINYTTTITPTWRVPIIGFVFSVNGIKVATPIYYDPGVASKVRYLVPPSGVQGESKLERVSWQEIHIPWD